MFRVFSAPIIRSPIKTVDAITGTIHVVLPNQDRKSISL
jgi:hypothetical protein